MIPRIFTNETTPISNMGQPILGWLFDRHVSPEIIAAARLSWDGEKLVIPIFDAVGKLVWNRYRVSPFKETGGAKYWSDAGAKPVLYGGRQLKNGGAGFIFITEGELDVLCLISHGCPAVSSTGGALSWQDRWSPFFKDFEVFVCYDNDTAGQLGAAKMIGSLRLAGCAKIKNIVLPAKTKDTTEFLVKNDGNIQALVDLARPWRSAMPPKLKFGHYSNSFVLNNVLPLTPLLERYGVKIKSKGSAQCPWHDDKNPSLAFSDEKGTFRCMTGCAAGNAIAFIKKFNDIGFREAIVEAEKIYGRSILFT